MQRIYVHHLGRDTTISVDDILLSLLGAKLKQRLKSADVAMQKRFARQVIRIVVETAPDSPEGGLSQYVQRGIILAVSEPALCSSLTASDAQYAIDIRNALDTNLSSFIDAWLKQMKDLADSLKAVANKKPRRKPKFIAKNKNPRRNVGMKESASS